MELEEDTYLGCLRIECDLLEMAIMTTESGKPEDIIKTANMFRDFVFREKE